MPFRSFLAASICLLICHPGFTQNTTNHPVIGHVDRFEPQLNQLIPDDAQIEVLCSGFDWAEGPVWVPDKSVPSGGFVLFSDIPPNSVMKWQEGVGVSLFMKPSGYTGVADYGREPGSNGDRKSVV